MRIFPTVIRRVTTVIGGTVNYLARTRAATRLSWVGTLIERVRPATRMSFSPARLVVSQRPAIRLLTFSVAELGKVLTRPATRLTALYSGTLRPVQKPAIRLTFGAPLLLKTVERLATNMLEAFISGEHTSYVVAAAEDAVGTGNWSNPTRIQGQEQGTQAGSASYSGGLVLGSRKLRGTAMVAQLNRPYVIDEVWLRFHYQTTGLPVVSDLISNLELGYRINTAPTPTTDTGLAGVTSNNNFLVAGNEIRIDNGAGAFNNIGSTPVTWANIALLQPYFGATTIANGLMTYYADAIRLRVVFHEIVAL